MPDKDPKENIVESIFKKDVKNPEKESKITSFLEKGSDIIQKIETISKSAIKKGKDVQKLYPFGVDVGTSFVKFAQFARDVNGDLQLFDLGMFEMPVMTRETSEFERGEFVVKLFKNVFKDKKPKDVVISLPANAVDIKILKLPVMPQKEINDAVLWELRQTYGERIEDFSLDTILLNEEAEANKEEFEVLLIIATKKVVGDHVSIFKRAGFNVLAVEVDPLALNEILVLSGGIKDGAVGILDIGSNMANLSISLKGKVYFSRNLSVNGGAISKSIASYCAVDPNTAESLKINFGIEGTSGDGMTVRNAIIPLLENLASDVDHSFKYFSYQLMKSKVLSLDKLILSGGTAHLKGLVGYLKTRLNIPVELADPLKNVNVNSELYKKFNIEKLAANFAVSIGLAYRNVEEEL